MIRIYGSVKLVSRIVMPDACVRLIPPDDGVDRLYWIYKRNVAGFNGDLFTGDQIATINVTDGGAAHYGIIVLRVENGEVLREDGHVVVGIKRTTDPSWAPTDITNPDLAALFGNVSASAGPSVTIAARSLENPSNGQQWTCSHIVDTKTVVSIKCEEGLVAWDTHRVYADIALKLANDAIRYNEGSRHIVSNPAFQAEIDAGMGMQNVSLSGLARVSEMQLSWHSMPTPGTFGLTEARPIALGRALWNRVVELAAMMCGFNESTFSGLVAKRPLGADLVNHLCAYSDRNGVALNCLEALAGIAVSILSFTAQWKVEKYDNITSMAGKLGTEQDCEDQATNTVAIIMGLVQGLSQKRDVPLSPLAETLATLVKRTVTKAELVLGLVDEHIATAGKTGTEKSEVLGGHGWCSMTFADNYRPGRKQRTFFVESTCPYLIHPVDDSLGYVGTFTALYGSALSLYTDDTLIRVATYKTPQLQPASRYKFVAFVCTATQSLYVGPAGQSRQLNRPFVIGVTAADYVCGNYADLDAAAHSRNNKRIYDAVFGRFVFHPNPDPDHSKTLRAVLKSGVLTRNGNYKLSDKSRYHIEETLGRQGTPTESVVIVSSFDWHKKHTSITKQLTNGIQNPNVDSVYTIISLPMCDLVVLGNISIEDDGDDNTLFGPSRTIRVQSLVGGTSADGRKFRHVPEFIKDDDIVAYINDPSAPDDPGYVETYIDYFRQPGIITVLRKANKPLMMAAAASTPSVHTSGFFDVVRDVYRRVTGTSDADHHAALSPPTNVIVADERNHFGRMPLELKWRILELTDGLSLASTVGGVSKEWRNIVTTTPSVLRAKRERRWEAYAAGVKFPTRIRLEEELAWTSCIEIDPINRKIYAGRDGTIRVYSIDSGDFLYAMDTHATAIASMIVGPNSNVYVCSMNINGDPGQASVWSGQDGTQLHVWDDIDATMVAVDSNNNKVYIGDNDGGISVCASETRIPLYSMEADGWRIRSIVVGPDGRVYSQGLGSNFIKVWSGVNGAFLLEIKRPGIGELKAVDSNNKVYTVRDGAEDNDDDFIRCWSGVDGKWLYNIYPFNGQCHQILVGPKSGNLYMLMDNEHITIVSGDDGKVLHVLSSPGGNISTLTISSDETLYGVVSHRPGRENVYVW